MSFNLHPEVKFLDPEKIMFQTGLTKDQTVADLGAGSGFYALASAKIVGARGTVFVADILEGALNNVASHARIQKLQNIKTMRVDLETETLAVVPDGSVDMVIMGNILHQLKNKAGILREAFRMLKTGGKLLVVDWNDQPSPFGPTAQERIKETEVSKLGQTLTFKFIRKLEADRFHFCLLMEK